MVEQRSVEDRFQDLLGTSAVGGDDAGLLDLAAKFSLQLDASQIRVCVGLLFAADMCISTGREREGLALTNFVKNWLDYKKYHGSDFYFMRALDSVSLRKYIGQNPFNVDVVKK